VLGVKVVLLVNSFFVKIRDGDVVCGMCKIHVFISYSKKDCREN
jgi:hypothetical protein